MSFTHSVVLCYIIFPGLCIYSEKSDAVLKYVAPGSQGLII